MMKIRMVTWRGFQNLSMPCTKFASDILGMSDAVNWGHWAPIQVTFAGITKSANEWSTTMLDHFNEAEMAEYEKLRK